MSIGMGITEQQSLGNQVELFELLGINVAATFPGSD